MREALIFRGSQRWSEFSPFVEYEDDEASQWLAGAISWANDPLPSSFRQSIPVNATLPAVGPDEVADVLSPFGRFSSVKIKVAEKGQDLEDDIARARRVRDLYPDNQDSAGCQCRLHHRANHAGCKKAQESGP